MILRNCRLIPELSEKSLPLLADVEITGKEITAITAARSERPMGKNELDGRGKTLLPGLFDLHAHLSIASAEETPEAAMEKLLQALPALDAVKPEEFAACAKEAVLQGYDAVKANFFVHDEEGRPLTGAEQKGILSEKHLQLIEDRVAAVREAIGAERAILMECHGYTDTVSFLRIARRIADYDIVYAEEPAATAFPVLRKLEEKSGIPLSMGERLHSLREFQPFISAQAVRFVQPDIGNCRGLTEAKKIAQLCTLYDVGIQFHCANSHLNVAATLQMEAAMPNFVIHEHCCVHERDYVCKLTKRSFQPQNGCLCVPEEPGIGNELSDYTLQRCEMITVR